jgi:hypothetical protein
MDLPEDIIWTEAVCAPLNQNKQGTTFWVLQTDKAPATWIKNGTQGSIGTSELNSHPHRRTLTCFSLTLMLTCHL